MNKVKINDKEYNVKYTLRSLFLYEQITKKPFTLAELEYVINRYIFAYCIVLASNLEEETLDWDDFISACDKDNSIITTINDIVMKEQKINQMINGEETSEEPKKE